jgi:hypothetical protein
MFIERARERADDMIVLFTDFGLQGPYTGQVKAVLQQRAPGIPVIDLFADAPVGNPMASAYLLAAYAPWFPSKTVFLCVIDPGVGGTRPAIVLEEYAQGGWSSSALRLGDSPTAAEGTASDVTIANGECVVAKVRRFL